VTAGRPTFSRLGEADLSLLQSGVPEGSDLNDQVPVPLDGLAEVAVERLTGPGYHGAIGQGQLAAKRPGGTANYGGPVAASELDRVWVVLDVDVGNIWKNCSMAAAWATRPWSGVGFPVMWATMSGWCTAFIPAKSWALNASSPFFMSSSRCAVRVVVSVVVVMGSLFLVEDASFTPEFGRGRACCAVPRSGAVVVALYLPIWVRSKLSAYSTKVAIGHFGGTRQR